MPWWWNQLNLLLQHPDLVLGLKDKVSARRSYNRPDRVLMLYTVPKVSRKSICICSTVAVRWISRRRRITARRWWVCARRLIYIRTHSLISTRRLFSKEVRKHHRYITLVQLYYHRSGHSNQRCDARRRQVDEVWAFLATFMKLLQSLEQVDFATVCHMLWM